MATVKMTPLALAEYINIRFGSNIALVDSDGDIKIDFSNDKFDMYDWLTTDGEFWPFLVSRWSNKLGKNYIRTTSVPESGCHVLTGDEYCFSEDDGEVTIDLSFIDQFVDRLMEILGMSSTATIETPAEELVF